MKKYDPRYRSQFVALEETLLVEQSKNTQLQLEVEKLKSSIVLNDDRESESGAESSVSIKVWILEHTYGP